MIRAMRAAERAHGKTMGELVAEWVFSEDWKKASAAVQLYLREVLARSGHQDVTVTKTAAEPHIQLPAMRPDPAKVVVLGDKA